MLLLKSRGRNSDATSLSFLIRQSWFALYLNPADADEAEMEWNENHILLKPIVKQSKKKISATVIRFLDARKNPAIDARSFSIDHALLF
jgi:hypothetical protein